MHLIFVGQGYPRKLFNLEHFPIYGIHICTTFATPVRDITVDIYFKFTNVKI